MIHIKETEREQIWDLQFTEGIHFLIGALSDGFSGVLVLIDAFCIYKGIPSILYNINTPKMSDEELIKACKGKHVVLIDNAEELLNERLLDEITGLEGVEIIIASFNQFYYSEREGVQYKYLVDTPELITTYDINVRVGVKNDSI